MSWNGMLRSMQAAQRREERDAQKRQRELERRAKEQAKLTAIEQAHLEVETYENKVEMLLSVHKEQGRIWDWGALMAALPPPQPRKNSYFEFAERQRALVLPPNQKGSSQAAIEQAQQRDTQAFREALECFKKTEEERRKLKDLAWRILSGENAAYLEALAAVDPLAEISQLTSKINFIAHDAKMLECVFKVSSKDIIPAEVKTLTSSEKLSIKQVPKGRFYEIYQGFICACVFRIAREVFALLPVGAVLITAATESVDSRMGWNSEQPVLSIVLPRSIMTQLKFELVDPAHAIENYMHRGSFKTSRKSETFESVIPLVAADMEHKSVAEMGLSELIIKVQLMREDLKSKITSTIPQLNATSAP